MKIVDAIPGEKTCRMCLASKFLEEFGGHKGNKDGKSIYCKMCTRIRSGRQYASQGESLIKNPSRFPVGSTLYFREKMLKLKYGISLEQYNQLFLDQKGRCAICRVHQSRLREVLHIDHDHETGVVRGLLCNNCNRGLGMFKDSQANLESALIYIRNNYAEKNN